jgi:hypothetical protein
MEFIVFAIIWRTMGPKTVVLREERPAAKYGRASS